MVACYNRIGPDDAYSTYKADKHGQSVLRARLSDTVLQTHSLRPQLVCDQVSGLLLVTGVFRQATQHARWVPRHHTQRLHITCHNLQRSTHTHTHTHAPIQCIGTTHTDAHTHTRTHTWVTVSYQHESGLEVASYISHTAGSRVRFRMLESTACRGCDSN